MKTDFPIKTYQLPGMALNQYIKLGFDDNPVRSFGDPAYIKLSIAKVVENNRVSLKTTLKTTISGDTVSVDGNFVIY